MKHKSMLLSLVVLLALATLAFDGQRVILQIQNAGSTIATWTGYGKLNCGTGTSCSASGSTVTLTATGSGGTAGTGACTNQVVTAVNAGAPTCATVTTALIGTLAAGSNGLATSATTDATNAGNIATGLLAVARGGTNLASGTSGGILGYTAAGTLASSVALTANVLTKGGGAGATPTNSSITDDAATISTAEFISSGNTVRAAADFTTAANTSLQTITGLSWTFPANKAVTLSFHCALNFSQATAAVAVAFGIQGATVTPTQINANGTIFTNTTTETTGTLVALASTTATNIVSATPGATATVFKAELDGTVEEPSNASAPVVNIMVSTATSGDAVTVKRGSWCSLH